MRPSYSLAELIPHRGRMVLVDEVVDFDAEGRRAVVAFRARPEWTGNWCAIEYMAQAAAALTGLHDRFRNEEAAARPGFLLGTRRLELGVERFEAGRRYLVTVVNEFADGDAASFACVISDEEGRSLATANLNAYRPPDIAEFLRSVK